MDVTIRRDATTPIYRQIVEQVRDQIVSGVLPAGFRLPPVRQIAAQQGLTRLTVHSAYAELQAQGLVEAQVGRGTFVAPGAIGHEGNPDRVSSRSEWMKGGLIAGLLRADASRDMISFAQAFPAPEALPVRELERAMRAVLKGSNALGYGPMQGHVELREAIAALVLERGVSARPDNILVTAGAQQGIDVVLGACTQPGDTIAVEEPTYPGILDVAALRHLKVIGVPADEGGIRVDALRTTCTSHRPRLLYLVPTCSNPAGRTLAQERRAALLHLAHAHGVTVVEDDIYGLLPFDAPAPPALKSDDAADVVIYVISFSKMVAPALRIGGLIAPPSLLPGLAAAKGSSDLVCSSLLQLALAGYLRQGHLAPHLRAVRDMYRERAEAMCRGLERYLPACRWSRPEGGLSMWVRLPDGVSERDFATDAFRAGVALVPGGMLFPDAQQHGHMRLSFGTEPPERIERGLRLLGRVLEGHLRRNSAAPVMAHGTASPLV